MGAVSKLALVILGPQGCGKGTQAKRLAKKLNLTHFEMGDYLRSKQEFQQTLAAGELVGDRTVDQIIRRHLRENHRNRLMFDGVPRTISQAKMLDVILHDHGFALPFVIYLNINRQTSIVRLLKRGREDDTQEIIEQRLDAYEQETKPVINYYKKQKRLIEINGEQPVNKVTEDIVWQLNSKLPRK